LIQAASGTHFDPGVVDAMLEVFAADGVTPERARAASDDQPRTAPRGYGTQLKEAFERLDRLPAASEGRDRLLELLADDRPSPSEIVSVVESDLALVVTVLRLANRGAAPRARTASVPSAVERLTAEHVEMVASRIAVVDFFERHPEWGGMLE